MKCPGCRVTKASLDPLSYPLHRYYCTTSGTAAVIWRIGSGTENNPKLCPLGCRWRQKTFPVFVRSCQLLQYPLLSSSRYLVGRGLPACLCPSVCLDVLLSSICLSVCLCMRLCMCNFVRVLHLCTYCKHMLVNEVTCMT